MRPEVQHFFDPATWTLTYVVWDPDTLDAVVIDPVLDYDPQAVSTHERSAAEVVAFLRARGLTVQWVLETHAHADHLSGGQVLARELGAKTAIGARITEVQEVFRGLFDLGPDFPVDGRQFDRLLEDGEVLQAGSLRIETLATPGHTPACVSYRIGDAVFTGDALFMPDYGTGRCDFPRGSATDLYRSVQRLHALPDETRVFVGHDYQPGGRELRYETTIGASKRDNVQIADGVSEEAFVRFRTERDATLRPPNLIFQSIQVNIRGGRLPEPHANGRRYLALPMGVFD